MRPVNKRLLQGDFMSSKKMSSFFEIFLHEIILVIILQVTQKRLNQRLSDYKKISERLLQKITEITKFDKS